MERWGRALRSLAPWAACLILLAVAAGNTGPVSAAPRARHAAAYQICRSWKHHGVIARRISNGIRDVLSRRRSVMAIRVDDPYLGIGCYLHVRRHFDSASVIKATILAALLHKAHARHRSLTSRERDLAWKMITHSDNDAATALWNDVGLYSLRRFCHLAGMKQTALNTAGYWGLSQITAHDEMTLLQHLLIPNPVLTKSARRYELRLMEHVIASQRWGVTAGVPAGFNVHVKNGWLPTPPSGDWWVNSIGCFTSGAKNYSIVVLTWRNPGMAYGVTSIEDVAEIVNRHLRPHAAERVPRSRPFPSWGIPDERIPRAAM
jgi:beta-lactamase class A